MHVGDAYAPEIRVRAALSGFVQDRAPLAGAALVAAAIVGVALAGAGRRGAGRGRTVEETLADAHPSRNRPRGRVGDAGRRQHDPAGP
jgi:hypothetical protein